MGFLYGLFIFSFAGAINGSFALPSKRLTRWTYQRIWLNYSIWAFLLFPCLFVTLLAPSAWRIYTQMPAHLLAIILIGGFLFAIGQICFAKTLQLIGFSLGFLINIGIGTALGSLIPLLLQHSNQAFTTQSTIAMIGIAVIIAGLLLSYVAGLKRDRAENKITKSNHFFLGVLLAVCAGIFSAGQNITFSYTAVLQQYALQSGVNHLVAANIIWPAFLIATFFPYAAYMISLRYQHRSAENNYRSFTYYGATMFMGACWFFSLILYSAGSLMIGSLGPIIGWPLFMVCIILFSNMWG